MISLDNFYYILYTNLFSKATFNTNYFYPFGSTEPSNLVSIVPDNLQKSLLDYSKIFHQCIFYDQEPLIKESVAKLADTGKLDFDQRRAFFLITSEISELVNTLSDEYHLVNFYYFFHGFAALYWYNDYKYFTKEYEPQNHYLCLNHLVTNDRSYRLNLVSGLIERGLIDKGSVSLHANKDLIDSEITNVKSKLSVSACEKIKKYLIDYSLPMVADKTVPSGGMSADTGPLEHYFYQSSFLHVVPETVFYYPKLHLTEKIFKPIVNKRPFILVAAPGNLAYLKRYGFKTFDRWIDESYDTETDDDKRIQLITDQIEKICSLSASELKQLKAEMDHVLEFNFQHFFGKFKEIIVDEFLNNFKSCANNYNKNNKSRALDLSAVDFDHLRQLLLS